ncbi:MAG: hypothetical protein F6K14_23465 [Symploca sp. SIO2C1]|nr:hypothetical protein [Symploca sp. SIO2C1]
MHRYWSVGVLRFANSTLHPHSQSRSALILWYLGFLLYRRFGIEVLTFAIAPS